MEPVCTGFRNVIHVHARHFRVGHESFYTTAHHTFDAVADVTG
jgi:hypothetical protein